MGEANPGSRLSLPALMKDALAAAAVAALLAFPLLGFYLENSVQGINLQTRFIWIAYSAAAVFAGRIAIRLLREMIARRDWQFRLPKPAFLAPVLKYETRIIVAIAMISVALLLPWLPFSDRSLIHTATLILIYVVLGWGLNIVVGLAGLLDLGYVAFYAVGAYSYALLSQYFGLSFWICLPLAGFIAALFGILLGFPVLRLRGDYLAIVTLGFGEIVREIIVNWQSLTGGPNGIISIARPSFFGLPMEASTPGTTTFADFFGLEFSPLQRVLFLYYLILALALLTNFFVLRVRKLPLGRAWEALREDEIACRSLGLNPTSIKLSAFAIGAGIAGLAGPFFAVSQGAISPESFTFIESAIILAIVVLGGMGSQTGIVLAAILLVGLPEWFRELKEFRMVAFGAAMVLIMLWRPQGLLSHREPTLRLDRPEKKAPAHA
jgi:branched-chain amino acid transport system permease protein